jgi:peptidoglycan/LPS O-acetylase OafA/YrhL
MRKTSQTATHSEEVTALRALAVLGVMIFHFWPRVLPGGYVGVDVFFVVSGFVVSRAYLARLIGGDLSWQEFFWRRVRRLLPAAVLVFAASTATAWVVLEPNELVLFARSLLAQVVYAQNLLFWIEGDYFHGALHRPLLHTWSLAVEEQFYVGFVLLAFVLRRIRNRFSFVVSLAVLSLGFAFLAMQVSPKTAFFLLPTRAWQLLLGVAAASVYDVLQTRGWPSARPSLAGGLKVVSVVIICASFAVFDESARFPGIHALLACGATLLFLLSSTFDAAARWRVAHPFATWVGDRSYALYLWHWPLVVFPVMTWASVSLERAVAAFVLTFLVSAVTFKYVEDPIRQRILLPKSWQLQSFAVGSMVCCAGTALALLSGQGYPQRFPEPAAGLFAQAREQNHGRCGFVFRASHLFEPACPVSKGVGDGRGLLIVGDSHADAIDNGLASRATEIGERVYLADTSCDLWRLTGKVFRCGDAYAEKLIHFARNRSLARVLFVSSWSDFKHEGPAEAALRRFQEAGLEVFVSGPLPAGEVYDPAAQARRLLKDPSYAPPRQSLRSFEQQFDRSFRFLERLQETTTRGSVRLLWPHRFLCDETGCAPMTDGLVNFYDDGHLSSAGVARVLPAYEELFR